MTKNYLTINKDAYDALAEEFRDKVEIRKENSERIFAEFEKYLAEYRTGTKILELGPAAGYDTKLFSEHGYDVTALEISPKLARFCKITAPQARVIVGEFMEYEFNETFDGILAIAFIHLFPKTDTHQVLEKMHSLLKLGGLAYISTTLHEHSTEGFISKKNFNHSVLRFRRQFTEQELVDELNQAGFTILGKETTHDKEEANKVWIDFIVKK
jgi:SAM-dependent methyltransferase